MSINDGLAKMAMLNLNVVLVHCYFHCGNKCNASLSFKWTTQGNVSTTWKPFYKKKSFRQNVYFTSRCSFYSKINNVANRHVPLSNPQVTLLKWFAEFGLAACDAAQTASNTIFFKRNWEWHFEIAYLGLIQYETLLFFTIDYHYNYSKQSMGPRVLNTEKNIHSFFIRIYHKTLSIFHHPYWLMITCAIFAT